MKKYNYKGMIIEYAGFKLEDKFCFYYKDTMIYLSLYSVSKLIEL